MLYDIGIPVGCTGLEHVWLANQSSKHPPLEVVYSVTKEDISVDPMMWYIELNDLECSGVM